ncbi:hypothetical protein Tco_0275052, partial [Tanacetum coccineum]
RGVEGSRGGETVMVVAWLRWPRWWLWLWCGDDGVGEDDVVRIVVVVAANNSGCDGEMYAVDVMTRRW